MKLTIGMIVKNEEKYLDRCLSAIKPILDSVDSELIITDTGSADRTVGIAEKYTDKVLHFDWCDDFAAARNTAFALAKGEWFMFLDADEIFASCDDIVGFFNTNECEQYNSATFVINNPSNDNASSYSFNAQRITRILPETRFVGAVHESLSTFGEPMKRLKSTADHYGYCYETESAKINKFERNSKLLLKRLEAEDPVDPMLFIQLYETYAIVNRFAEANKYLDMGIEYCKKNKSIVLAVMYAKKAYARVFNGQYNDAVVTCGEYLDMDSSIRPGELTADREIYAILASSYLRMNRSAEAEDAFVKFFDIYEKVENGTVMTPEADLITFWASADYNYIPFVNAFLHCCIGNGHYGIAAEMMSKLPIKKHSDNRELINDTIKLESRIIERLGDEYFGAFSEQLDDYGKTELKKAVEKINAGKNNGGLVLTIGMIVKNEEKYLDRCLSALKPILDNVASELIITDTGSTDGTVDIAKKYTDKIRHFDWCDDFAKARNTAFEIAKGEWFMFVDADDVFTDCDALIRFLNSDEHDKYGSASFTYRNIRSSDGSEYIDQYVIRIVRRSLGTKFVGRIHEVLDPMPEPVKALEMIVHHYGYLYGSDNDAGKKTERNERILLREISETPKNDGRTVLLYYYLYQELRELDNQKAREYLDKGIEIALAVGTNMMIPLIHEKIRIYLVKQEYDTALALCGKYFGLDKAIRSGEICADAEVYAAKAIALQESGKYPEACGAFAEFFRVYDLMKSGKLVTSDRYLYLSALSGEDNYGNMIVRYINCCCCAGKRDTIESFLRTSPFPGYLSRERRIGLFPGIGILMKAQMDISPLFPGDSDAVVTAASLCCEHVAGFYEAAEAYDIGNIRDDEMLTFTALFYEACLNKALSVKRNIKALIKRFADTGRRYGGSSANDSISLAALVWQAEKALNDRQYKECIALLKNALQKYNRSADIIRAYIDIVSAEFSEASEKVPVSEMEKLAAAIKHNIRAYISAGNHAAAKKTLDEYKKLMPNDPETEELIKLIQGE